jgi:squalene-hopene/tetraprenyl-beta-curcumene cyclase
VELATRAHLQERARAALNRATEALLAEMEPEGFWSGHLSSSALSTATALVALHAVDRARGRDEHQQLIDSGCRWLAANQNADGGWGDTIRSKSNISTTALCWAALKAAGGTAPAGTAEERASAWLRRAGDRPLPKLIEARYGKDRTFSVPILMHMAICGQVSWSEVPPLPFELAALPHQLFGALKLPVVSYALPALIAIGQAIHHHHPSWNPLPRLIRNLSRRPTLAVLEMIQPENGGFLEATPLTSFVTMALASAGQVEHRVVHRAVEFLRASVREDGSWPIDTNLATWVTTLSIKALAHQPGALTPEQRLTLREWLSGQQYTVEHPYTHAAPGGWAWTPLPGGVPDADDTPGALLALLSLGVIDGPMERAAPAGANWLLGLQNSDGGIPTFCRGWGALPFDRSSPDLTAHTLRAWSAWLPHLRQPQPRLAARLRRGIQRGLRFLERNQRPDGSWLPLWFGNEHAPDDENPLYGTSLVVCALRDLRESGEPSGAAMVRKGCEFLCTLQNGDGGWGGVSGAPSTLEETALALEALAGTEHISAVERGAEWLCAAVEREAWIEPAPIGFYFAKLWYFERLYPLIWTVGALGRFTALGSLAQNPGQL